jgi:flavin-dependent dehydrogenase
MDAPSSSSSSSLRSLVAARRSPSTLAARATTASASVPVSGPAPTDDGPVGYYYRPMAAWPTDVALPAHELASAAAASPAAANAAVDLVVAGAGPAGLAVAERVARAGYRVCVVDPDPLGIWPNNYGVWVDEFQAMGLSDCLEVVWPKARVLLDSTAEGDKRLARPYGRVDRPRLKRKLLERCAAAGVTFLRAAVEAVEHQGGRSTVKARTLVAKEAGSGSGSNAAAAISPSDFLTLCSAVGHGEQQQAADGSSSSSAPPVGAGGPISRTKPAAAGGGSGDGGDGGGDDDPTALRLTGSLVLDATGHSRRLVEFDRKFDPGYQGAYGIVAEVESHPFKVDEMTFMDWRDDHLEALPELKARNSKLPTFLYAMPFSATRVFLEETSLVARPAVPFDDLKARLEARMRHLGIKVKRVEEEEFCLIPMGGSLPKHPQRVLAVGGTAGMVHPSTGFAVSRLLGAAPTVADAIVDALARPTDKAARAAAAVAKRQGAMGGAGAGAAGFGGGLSSSAAASSTSPVAASLPYADEPAPAFASAASITTLPAVAPPRNEREAELMAASVWRAAWPLPRLRQRAFFCFGMDVLLRLDLAETRQFFAAFFALSPFHWHGFLSARLGFTQLIGFGLSLFVKASPAARANLLARGLPGLVGMLVGLVPTVVGDYYPREAGEGEEEEAEEEEGAAGSGGGRGGGGGGGSEAAAAPMPTTR